MRVVRSWVAVHTSGARMPARAPTTRCTTVQTLDIDPSRCWLAAHRNARLEAMVDLDEMVLNERRDGRADRGAADGDVLR